MNRSHRAIHATTIALSLSAHARAQVVSETFDPNRNGPWTVNDLGNNESADFSNEPKSLAVTTDGRVYVAAKIPIGGPPRDGLIFRVDGGKLEQVGDRLGEDPDTLLDSPGGLLVGTKGTVVGRSGNVFRLSNGVWEPLSSAPLASEVESMLSIDGATWVGTKNDGAFRLTEAGFERVGATTQVTLAGFHWQQLGDSTLEFEAVAALPNGDAVVAGKLDVFVHANGELSTLGDLSGAAYDAARVPISFLREVKSVAVSPSGTVYAGTKGQAGSAEGPDAGRLWRWRAGEWQMLGAAPGLRKEVKVIQALADDRILLAGNESGIWQWDGDTLSEQNDGIVAVNGHRKCEALVHSGGRAYAGILNALYERPLDGSAPWREIGFFEFGEEIKTVAVNGSDEVYVGAKVGSGAGAVYRLGTAGFEQLGPDLAREAKQIAFGPDGTLYATLGGGGGTVRWTGDAWESVLGALVGAAAELKRIEILPDGSLLAAAKSGLQHGRYLEEAQTIVNTPLRNLEAKGLVSHGGHIYAATKVGGVFRLVDDPSTDDGRGWQNDAIGLPAVELEDLFSVEDAIFVASNRLLYRGVPDADGRLTFTPFGTNPGAAALDGDGRLIFRGEAKFTGVARDRRGRLFAGTSSGVWLTLDDGRSWSLFNGPAEVKSIAIAGDVLYAAIKEKVATRPGDPAYRREQAAIWSRSLSDESPGHAAETTGRVPEGTSVTPGSAGDVSETSSPLPRQSGADVCAAHGGDWTLWEGGTRCRLVLDDGCQLSPGQRGVLPGAGFLAAMLVMTRRRRATRGARR